MAKRSEEALRGTTSLGLEGAEVETGHRRLRNRRAALFSLRRDEFAEHGRRRNEHPSFVPRKNFPGLPHKLRWMRRSRVQSLRMNLEAKQTNLGAEGFSRRGSSSQLEMP